MSYSVTFGQQGATLHWGDYSEGTYGSKYYTYKEINSDPELQEMFARLPKVDLCG